MTKPLRILGHHLDMLDTHTGRAEAPSGDAPGPAGTSSRDAQGADIGYLGTLLDQSLGRQEGPDLVALVHRVRALTEQSVSSSSRAADELRALLCDLDLPTAIRLVRAFSAFSHLANVAEQVHQAEDLADGKRHGWGRLRQTVDRILAKGSRRNCWSGSSAASNFGPCSPLIRPKRPAGRC